MLGKGLAQFDLAQLAGRGHRHFIQDPDEFRHLEAAEVLAAMLEDSGFVGLCTRFQFDKCRDRLAPLRMRQADHGGVLHGGMGEQRLLDLDGRDVLAAGLDHVLLAVEEQHLAMRVDEREIAGVMPAEFARLFGRLRVLVIAHHDVGPAMHQLAGLSARQQMALIIHDRGLVHDQRFAPVIAETLQLPVGLRHRGGRIHFGLAAAENEIRAQVGDGALQQRAAHRRHGVDAGSQTREVVFPAARVIKDRLIHQRQADENGQLVAHDGFHADYRIEASHQRHSPADRQIAQEQHVAGAVEQRELPGDAVVAAKLHLDGVAHHRHHHGEMAMHRGLRPRRGARGIDDHRADRGR